MRTAPIGWVLIAWAGLAGTAVAGLREERTLPVQGPVHLTLVLTDGNVTVKAGPARQVHVVAVKSDPQDQFGVQQTGSQLRLVTRRGRIHYEITVPKETDLEAHNVNGSLHVIGLAGKVDAATNTGGLHLEGLTGPATAKTVTGPVVVRQAQGEALSTHSISGDLTLDDVRGHVEARTVSGRVHLRNARCQGLTATTTSGDLSYQGHLPGTGEYKLTSHAGSIELVLPPDASFSVRARTFSGIIRNDWPLNPPPAARPGQPLREIKQATHGDGRARLELKTFSGSIRLRQPP